MTQKGKISAYKIAGKSGYGASFYHPLLKRRVTRGLGTKLEMVAVRICEGLESLCTHPETPRAEFKGHPDAFKIFHKDVPAPKNERERIVRDAQALFPELTETQIEKVVLYIETQKGFSLEMLNALPEIVALIQILEKAHAQPAAFTALRRLLNKLSARLDTIIHDLKAREANDIIALKCIGEFWMLIKELDSGKPLSEGLREWVDEVVALKEIGIPSFKTIFGKAEIVEAKHRAKRKKS